MAQEHGSISISSSSSSEPGSAPVLPELKGTPVFARRGYMLDVSRDRVPTRQTLGWLVEMLSRVGYNELQLYIEHTFAYSGHDAVWRDASAFTVEDLAWLAEHCRTRGLTLVANMNGFGHMERWLKLEEYRDRAECPDGSTSPWGGGHMGPTCFAPTQENADFAVDLARQMLLAVGGNSIHIGGDEPFELGDGASSELAARIGRDEVFLAHLNQIIEPLVADGNEVLFWGDFFRRAGSLVKRIPSGSVPVIWNYEAPSDQVWTQFLSPSVLERLGMPEDAHLGFAAHVREVVRGGHDFWVAPGTSTWQTLIGRNLNAAKNIEDAASIGQAEGASGYLVTDWGDAGHWQPLCVSLPSLVRGGLASWNGTAEGVDVGSVIDDLLNAAPGTGALLDELGSIGEGLGVSSPNSSPLFSSILGPMPVSGVLDEAGVAKARETIAAVAAATNEGGFGGDRSDVMGAELSAACLAARAGLDTVCGVDVSHAVFAEIEAAQRDAWLMSSRPGGLNDSLARLRRPGSKRDAAHQDTL